MADDDKWKKFQQWRDAGASSGGQAPSGDGGMLSSAWAGVKGAGKQVAQDFGATGDWTKPDPEHSTADWVGRQAANWGPVVAVDAMMPEVGLPAGLAARFGPRLASLAGKGLTGLYKGAIGGAAMQPQDPARGGETGAGAGAAGGVGRAAFGMLPAWAKTGIVAGAPSAAILGHELGGGRYISPWAVHHGLSALGGLAAAAAGAPATTGAAASAAQNYMDPENDQGK